MSKLKQGDKIYYSAFSKAYEGEFVQETPEGKYIIRIGKELFTVYADGVTKQTKDTK